MNLKDATLLQTKAYLAGEWKSADDGKVLEVTQL
jgi:hypothetical protein